MPAAPNAVSPVQAALQALGALFLFQPGLREHDGSHLALLSAPVQSMLGQNGQPPLPALFSSMELFGLLYESATDNIVANPGGGQAGAVQLASEVNRITTVATSGDSVALPAAYPGLTVVVVNHGAQAMQVYGALAGATVNGVQGSDTINDVATGTGVSQMPGSEVIYVCVTAGKWYANGLGVGYSGSLQTQSLANLLTAHAGGGQAGALPITSMVSRFTTVATANDSAVLPAAVGNTSIGPLTIINAGANALSVFPNGTDAIGAGAAGGSYNVPAGKVANFYSAGPGVWHVVLSA